MYKESNKGIKKELLVMNQNYKKDIIWWNIISFLCQLFLINYI